MNNEVPVEAPKKTILVGCCEDGSELYRVDLLVAHLAIEGILSSRKNQKLPTENVGDWLDDYATWLASYANKPITITQAWLLIQNVGRELDLLKKRLHWRTDVAFWYGGINALTLTDEEVKAFMDELPRLQAQKEIQQRKLNTELSYERVYDLYLQAYRDEDKASRAATRFLEAQLKAGITPEI